MRSKISVGLIFVGTLLGVFGLSMGLALTGILPPPYENYGGWFGGVAPFFLGFVSCMSLVAGSMDIYGTDDDHAKVRKSFLLWTKVIVFTLFMTIILLAITVIMTQFRFAS